jgi:hypothetical protein
MGEEQLVPKLMRKRHIGPTLVILQTTTKS